jgi:hypothetical protein
MVFPGANCLDDRTKTGGENENDECRGTADNAVDFDFSDTGTYGFIGPTGECDQWLPVYVARHLSSVNIR